MGPCYGTPADGKAVSLQRFCLTGIRIPIIKIRWSDDRLIFIMEISIHYIETDPWALIQYKDVVLPV